MSQSIPKVVSRREMLGSVGGGLGMVALASMMGAGKSVGATGSGTVAGLPRISAPGYL